MKVETIGKMICHRPISKACKGVFLKLFSSGYEHVWISVLLPNQKVMLRKTLHKGKFLISI